MPPSPARRRQRGFSLIVVFLLIIVMVGVASAVMLSAQGDLEVSGHDRESVAALYAAETGVAWAQWYLYFQHGLAQSGATWGGLLTSTVPGVTASFCVAPGAPGGLHPYTSLAMPQPAGVVIAPGATVAPAPGTPVIFDQARRLSYQWCIHNNALDSNYGTTGAILGDSTDGDSIITIESWGWYGGGPAAPWPLSGALASSHLTVDVAFTLPTTNLANDYRGANVGGTNHNSGGISPTLPAAVAVSVGQ